MNAKNNSMSLRKIEQQYFKVSVNNERSDVGYIVAYIWDSDDELIPDSTLTPEWLCSILDSLPGYHANYYNMDSVFEMDDKFYKALINHKKCLSINTVNMWSN